MRSLHASIRTRLGGVVHEPRHHQRRRLSLAVIPAAAAVITLVLVVWFVKPHVSPQQVTGPGPRQRMANLTNADRADHDLPPLQLQRHVSRHALRHTRRMADAETIFHSTEKELRRALEGFRWQTIGENVGAGDTLASLEEAFMGSPDHRSNILNPAFDHIAVGVIQAGDALYLTVIYWG